MLLQMEPVARCAPGGFGDGSSGAGVLQPPTAVASPAALCIAAAETVLWAAQAQLASHE